MRKLIILLFLIAFLLTGFLLWWVNGLRPVSKTDTSQKSFIVRKGAGIREISNNLKNEGLVRDSVIFFLLVKQQGLEKKIQAGSFRLSPSQSAEQIAKSLTIGTQDIWITVPEGKRAEEIAEILKESLPTYNDTWLPILIENEGYLFPDTYLFPKEATIELIVATMRNTFDSRFEEVENHTNLSPEEIVILASLIEREARHQEDRPLVSSVMHNRLKIGMALEIDATVQYAIGTQNKWWPVLQDAARNIAPDSPYNTYRNTGLPPGPICNPGLAVMEAAANPADTDYLFYITDKTGTNRYARTNAEHNANIKKYGL